jgi:hypothetical protein
MAGGMTRASHVLMGTLRQGVRGGEPEEGSGPQLMPAW